MVQDLESGANDAVSWKMEYGKSSQENRAGKLLVRLVGMVLAATLVIAGWDTLVQVGQAVEGLAVHLREGMGIGAAAEVFCREVFPDGA